MRDVVLSQHDFDVDTRLAQHAKRLDDSSRGTRTTVTVTRDLDVDHLSVPRGDASVDVDLDVGVEPNVERPNKRTLDIVEASNDELMLTAQDAHDLALDALAASTPFPLQRGPIGAGEHEVSVHRTAQSVARDRNVGQLASDADRRAAVRARPQDARDERRELEQ